MSAGRAVRAWTLLALSLVAAAAGEGPADEPRLPPEIAVFRRQLWSAKSDAEPFHLVINERAATETARWTIARHPDLPFADPTVRIRPGGVTGSGVVEVLGRSFEIEGAARIVLQRGAPVVVIDEVSIGGIRAPDFLVTAIRGAFELARESYFDFSKAPAKLHRLELGDGAVLVEGTFEPRQRNRRLAD